MEYNTEAVQRAYLALHIYPVIAFCSSFQSKAGCKDQHIAPVRLQYIISIHIPIILTVFIPLALGWLYPNILSPVHIIFLAVIMGPTCSITYENEPSEQNTMQQPPRASSTTFSNWKELSASILQGFSL